MTANLKSVDLSAGTGVYDVVADDGTVLRAGVAVSGSINDATTVGTMKTFVTNHLTANKGGLKAEWQSSQNLTQLNAMDTAWDEAVV